MEDNKSKIVEGEVVPSQERAIATVGASGQATSSLMPTLLGSPEAIRENMKVFRDFVQSQMVEGEDFMVFDDKPGAKRNLLKPGAEKLLTYHGFGVEFTLDKESSKEEFNPAAPFLRFVYRARVYDKRTGLTVVDGVDGEANSYEERFHSTLKPEWELSPLEKEAAERGAYHKTERKRRDGQGKVVLFRIPNPPEVIFGYANTLRKMALKRALVPATIMACRASGVFTQDQEDPETIPGGVRTHRAAKSPAAASQAKPEEGHLLEAITTVRGLAKQLDLTLEQVNVICVEKTKKGWCYYDEEGNRNYPCTKEEAEVFIKELHRLIDERNAVLREKAKHMPPTPTSDVDELFGSEHD